MNNFNNIIVLCIILVLSVLISRFISIIYYKDTVEPFNVDTGEPEKKKADIVTLRDFLKNSQLLETYYPLYKKLWTVQKSVLDGIAVSIAAGYGNNNKEQYLFNLFSHLTNSHINCVVLVNIYF